MPSSNIQASPAFRKKAVRAILSIFLFAIVYLALVAAVTGIVVLAVYGGLMILINTPTIITIIAGLGLMGAAVLLLAFVLRFVFTRNKTDLSHLIEVTKADQPRLFSFVREIVKDTKSKFPGRIFISAEVNAAVFYNSSFWSLFFPVKKNLLIGMGLVNAITENEFRAILAHEFGHFSQRSMKVGSYVYHVNRIIYSMLFDNNGSYQKAIQGFANVSGYFWIFSWLVVKIIQFIQWVLRQVYRVVNVNYMALSREMEFHADEVAATAAGSQPLITSMWRLPLVDQANNTVINFYNEQIAANNRTANVYPQQLIVMNFLAKENNIPLEHGLPQITREQVERYSGSKLVIKDQWASHPSTEERVHALEALNRKTPEENNRLGTGLFDDVDSLTQTLTDKMFETVTYSGDVSYFSNEDFERLYLEKAKSMSFPKLFNGYYDNRNPGYEAEHNTLPFTGDADNAGQLFSRQMADLAFATVVLESDINTVKEMQQGNTGIKTFDYNGQKYTPSGSAQLLADMETELAQKKAALTRNDRRISACFRLLAEKQQRLEEWEETLVVYIQMDKDYEAFALSYTEVLQRGTFFRQQLRFEVIRNHIRELNEAEKTFRQHIRRMMEEPRFEPQVTAEIREDFRVYVSDRWAYFKNNEYDQYALSVLSKAMDHYRLVLTTTFLRFKTNLLELMAALMEKKEQA